MSFSRLPTRPISGTSVAGATQLNAWDPFERELILADTERWWMSGQDPAPRAARTYGPAAADTTYFFTPYGTVPAGITASGFTDTAQSWSTGPSFVNPWLGETDPAGTWRGPTQWTLLIDANEPEKLVRLDIGSWTSDSLDFSASNPGIADYIAARVISSVSDLIGRRYWIIGRGTLDWGQRVLQYPNARDYASGTVVTLAANTNVTPALPASPAPGLIRVDSPPWSGSNVLGKDLVFTAGDGHLHRATISATATASLLYFGSTLTASVGSTFIAVGTNRRAWPGRGPTYPFIYFQGKQDGYYTHSPGDAPVVRGRPAQAITLNDPNPDGMGACGATVDVPCFDENANGGDVWSDGTDAFSARSVDISPFKDTSFCPDDYDTCYTPRVWRTIRSRQRSREIYCTRYVERKQYSNAASIPNLNPAEVYRLSRAYQVANSMRVTVDAYSLTTGDVHGASGNDGTVDNQITLSGTALASLPASAQRYWFSVHRADGSYTGGRGILSGSNQLLASDGVNFTQSSTSGTNTIGGDNACTIILAPGPSRYVPREFKRIYDIPGVAVPDVVFPDGGGPPFAQDPFTPINWGGTNTNSWDGVGRFIFRGKSTVYIDRAGSGGDFSVPYGFANEHAGNTWDAFAVGDLARYIGDNVADPCTLNAIADGAMKVTSPDDPTAPYYERFYTGAVSKTHQPARSAQLSGTVSAGGTFWLRDPSKDWYNFQWFSGSPHTESGTATAGSTTGLSDSTKYDPNPASPTVESYGYWRSNRFVGFSSPYAGFPVEIDFGTGTNAGTFNPDFTDTRLVTVGASGTAAGTCSLTWAQATRASASGKPYRIVEPYFLNRYLGRTMTLLNATSGASIVATNTGNARSVLFFTTGSNTADLSAGTWSYAVADPSTGTVWRRDTNNATWTVPTGTDTARLGLPVDRPFRTDQRLNLATIVKRHGLFTQGDVVCAELFDEFYAAFQVLVWAKWPVSWSTNADLRAAINEKNAKFAGGQDDVTPGFETASGQAATNWASNPPNPFTEGGNPVCESLYSEQDSGALTGNVCHEVTLHRRYAYANLFGVSTRLPFRYTMYSFGDTSPSKSDGKACPSAVTFDNNGDPIAYRAWTPFGGGSIGTNGTGQVLFGGLGVPNGSYAGKPCDHWSGYELTDACAIVRGDAVGTNAAAFNFLDPLPAIP